MSITSFYAGIQQQLDEQLPFVVYRKAGEDIVQTFLQENDSLFETTDYTETGFIFAPFEHRNNAIIIPSSHSQYESETIDQPIVEINNIDASEIAPFKTKEEITKNCYQKLVAKGIEAISNDDFKKVVLSRNEEVGKPAVETLQLFKRLLHTYKNAFVYLWYHPKVGTWLGATPETLIKIQNKDFFTMALAGTQAYVNTVHVDWGKKEVEEQKMVTSFVFDQLSSIVKEVKCSNTYTHKAGTLLHLRTDISGVLNIKKSNIKDLISVLHPTPAVCGLPRAEARSFILSNEGYARKFYTGFLGELNISRENKKESNIFVNLRCMELINDKINLYIGGGVTKDSDPEKEWEETVKKTETMKRVLF